jgi:hypothetical protein
MALKRNELPDRFPVGTKFVIEGRPGARVSRYVELPDGTTFRLPSRSLRLKARVARKSRHLHGRV